MLGNALQSSYPTMLPIQNHISGHHIEHHLVISFIHHLLDIPLIPRPADFTLRLSIVVSLLGEFDPGFRLFAHLNPPERSIAT